MHSWPPSIHLVATDEPRRPEVDPYLWRGPWRLATVVGVIELEFEQRVDAAPHAVFARLADLGAYQSWLPAEAGWTGCQVTSTGPIGLGSTYVDHMRAGEMVGEVTRHDPPFSLQFHQKLLKSGRPVFEAVQTNELRQVEGGTLLRHSLHVSRLFGPLRLFRRRLARDIAVERERVLGALAASFSAQA